jgi:hypothetical protein
VDIKTEEIHWVDNVTSIIDSLEYKKEFNKDVLDDFVRSLSRRFPKKEFPIINYSPHIIYAYDKYIKMEEFLERFRWYFEEEYPGRKSLTQQQKEFYRSLLLTIDDNCKEIKRFGEDLLGITLNVIFYDNSYLMVGTKENEIMDYKFFFWDLGESQKEAKEHLVKQYLFIKYGDRDLRTFAFWRNPAYSSPSHKILYQAKYIQKDRLKSFAYHFECTIGQIH